MSEPGPTTDLDDRDECRFVEQVLLAFDGRLGPEGDAWLRARLAADVEKRRLFVGLCLQSQALYEILGSHRQIDLSDGGELEALGSRPAGLGDVPGLAWGGGATRARRRVWLPWLITTAACLLALLASGWAVWRWPSIGPPNARPVPMALPDRAGPAGGGRHVGADFEGMAMVIGLDGARWDRSEGPALAGGDILGARRLLLRSGRATLAFLSGVTLTLEGPADVDLVAIDRVFCRRGRLRARVPEGAEGFVVASPASTFTANSVPRSTTAGRGSSSSRASPRRRCSTRRARPRSPRSSSGARRSSSTPGPAGSPRPTRAPTGSSGPLPSPRRRWCSTGRTPAPS
jgi:hypothetical protein